jgi:acyl-CoA thioester hydrolase
MAKDFHMTKMVEFSDTDAAAVVHFSTYFRYMEEAECAFMRSLGFSAIMMNREPKMAWPRTKATCEYFRPCRFEEILDIRLRILEMGDKHMVYEYFFTREGKKIARGETRVVCCEFGGGKLKSVPMPAEIADAIKDYVHPGEPSAK